MYGDSDMEYYVTGYIINGVRLYAVERTDGYIDKYCTSPDRAADRVNELNA